MSTPRFSLSRLTLTAIVLGALALTVACGDDEETGDVKGSCDSMCKSAGFTASRLDEQPHELNCFCTGGTGTVTAEACTNMCKSAGKPGEPFGKGPDACQCQ